MKKWQNQYIREYRKILPLNRYDVENAGNLFYYFLAVCDFYGQYYQAHSRNRNIYLEQAQMSAKLLLWFERNITGLDGQWKLVPIEFEENWSVEQCQKIATDVALHMEKDQTAIGVFDGEEVIGFITVSHNIFGNTAKYVELVCFRVSEPYRGMGIGKALFYQACEEARRLGADKLYISAHSSKESQAAYKALGCVHAKEINQKLAEKEPCDVQLEYVLD